MFTDNSAVVGLYFYFCSVSLLCGFQNIVGMVGIAGGESFLLCSVMMLEVLLLEKSK